MSDEYRRLLAESERYAEQVDRTKLAAPPLAGIAIVTCMDSRIVPDAIFGLRPGDANVIRNAGAVATEDVLRSLVLSRNVLGTTEIVVMGHTGCGLYHLDEAALRARLASQTGRESKTTFGSFADVDEHVRRQVATIRAHPWISPIEIHGMIYEVETGRVRDVARV
ncbi:MAG TPA: carbonic anhydrase [Candidatus Limnocylindrales bacterium]|nr:carbonic anhydrase [Candidatus Limnocylindrales bacterium]